MRQIIIEKVDNVYRYVTYSDCENKNDLLFLIDNDINLLNVEIKNLNSVCRVLSQRRKELKLLSRFKECVLREIKNEQSE